MEKASCASPHLFLVTILWYSYYLKVKKLELMDTREFKVISVQVED